MNGGATAGSSRHSRLDPLSLPATVSVAGVGNASFTIDRERAVVRRDNGGPADAVPLASYTGVAVRVEAGRNTGEVRVFVELLHRDPALTLPLMVADEAEQVAVDWQAWGRALALPLVVVAPDGTVSPPLTALGPLSVFPPKPRRRHSHFAARRPRFLARRKPGQRSQPNSRRRP